MKHRKLYLLNIVLAVCVPLVVSCARAISPARALSSPTVLVGSTPGDALIKSLLFISSEKPVDFIRWDLTLEPAENKSGVFILNINFGESQPNTNGFKSGGEKLSLTGAYTVSKERRGDIYELKSESPTASISLVKINENLFHLLTPDKKLMVGNGGWSYTLNRRSAVASSAENAFSGVASLLDDAAISQKTTFEGRTPCHYFAEQYNLPVSRECIKLKWRITLFRDAKTNEPSTYALNSTFNRAKTMEGKWRIVKGLKSDPAALIYQIDLDQPAGGTLSFLVGDENILFFLDRENQLFTGNSDFSFTLNRRIE